MTPVEHNKQVALRMIEQLARGVIDDTLVTRDVQWWVPSRGLVSRAQFEGMVQAFRALKKGEGRIEVHGVTAEGDRVAVEAEAFYELVNGKLYNNTYHFLFEFSGGKIRLAKEYNDSRLAAEVLGGPLR
jgi:uncharacterized protein